MYKASSTFAQVKGLDGRAVKLLFFPYKVDDSHGILFDGWLRKIL
jgi:hypothetical protein